MGSAVGCKTGPLREWDVVIVSYTILNMERSHGLAVKVEDLQPRGRGFESWPYLLDGT